MLPWSRKRCCRPANTARDSPEMKWPRAWQLDWAETEELKTMREKWTRRKIRKNNLRLVSTGRTSSRCRNEEIDILMRTTNAEKHLVSASTPRGKKDRLTVGEGTPPPTSPL